MENLFEDIDCFKKRVSPQEFASFLGVTRKAVNDAIAAGRLEDSVETLENGYHKLDVPKAIFEWFDNADPSKDHENYLADARIKNTSEDQIPSFLESKCKKEFYAAKILALEYEEKLGTLVPRAAMENELYEIARTLRDRLLALAETLSPRLMGLDSAEIRVQIRSELERVLEMLSKGDKSLAS